MTKRVLWGLGGVAAALVLTAGILLATFDVEKHKALIEEAASAATGMKVGILGGVRLKLFPRASLSLENLFVQNRGLPVLSTRLSVASLRLLPLLAGKVRMQVIVLNAPKIFVTRDATGLFNFEILERVPDWEEVLGVLRGVERIFVTQGYVLYRDEATGRKIEAGECSFAFRIHAAGEGEPAGSPSLEGDVSCREAGTDELRVADVRAVVKAGGGAIEAKPVTMKILGGDGSGSVRRATGDGRPEYAVDLGITRLRFEELLVAFGQEKNVVGALDLTAHLAMRGPGVDEMTRTARGTVSLRGHDLRLENMDVDGLLEKVEKSQHFNLVDVGAFLVAGPLGTLVTKGYDFGSIFLKARGGKSAIRRLVSDWEVSGGVAEARDAAFTTEKNRMALRGKLDFVQGRFDDLSVAVLDAKGCALTSQKIHGDFKNPQVDSPVPSPSIVGAFISLLKKPSELFGRDECEIFYRGVIEQP